MYKELFSRYEELGGPAPKGPGIIVAGNWQQSWENLRMYWNMVSDIYMMKDDVTPELDDACVALEYIAKVHAEFFGVPKHEREEQPSGGAW